MVSCVVATTKKTKWYGFHNRYIFKCQYPIICTWTSCNIGGPHKKTHWRFWCRIESTIVAYERTSHSSKLKACTRRENLSTPSICRSLFTTTHGKEIHKWITFIVNTSVLVADFSESATKNLPFDNQSGFFTYFLVMICKMNKLQQMIGMNHFSPSDASCKVVINSPQLQPTAYESWGFWSSLYVKYNLLFYD